MNDPIDRAPAAASPPEPPSIALEPGLNRALAWTNNGSSVIAAGEHVSLWRGDPLAEVARRPLRHPTVHLSVSSRGAIVRCERSALCVLSTEDLAVERRLRCGQHQEARGGRWAPDGPWVVGYCADGTDPGMGDAGNVQTCVWDARLGRRLRCVETGQLPHHSQPFASRRDGRAILVSTDEGFGVLEPPAFESVHSIDADTQLDANPLVSWVPTQTQRLLVLTSFGGTFHDLGASEPDSVFEILGPLASHSWSPSGEELAIAYFETLAIHAPDGTVVAQRSVHAGAGAQVGWSADGHYLAVEWGDDEAAGFDVYARRGLARVFSGRGDGDRGWLPLAWHPQLAKLVFSDGRSLRVWHASMQAR